MSLLLRARVSSFLAGVAVAGVFGVYQLRRDVVESHDAILTQTERHCGALEARVAQVEIALENLQKNSS